MEIREYSGDEQTSNYSHFDGSGIFTCLEVIQCERESGRSSLSSTFKLHNKWMCPCGKRCL